MGLIALDGGQAHLTLECQQVEALAKRYAMKLIVVSYSFVRYLVCIRLYSNSVDVIYTCFCFFLYIFCFNMCMCK